MPLAKPSRAALISVLSGKVLRTTVFGGSANEKYILLTDPDTGLPVGYAGGFVEPLRFVSGSIPEIKGPEWFTSPPLLGELGEQIECGVAQTVNFFGARRCQRIDQAT